MRAYLAGLLLVMGAACSSPAFEGDNVEVRIVNASAFAFDSVRVVFPSDEVRYGPLAPGAASTYRPVQKAYSYAYIEVWTNGASFTLIPIDYVGESLLPSGRYSYRLGLAGEPRQLSFEFRVP